MTYGHGQLDMLAWLSGIDPDDDPMAPVCLPVRSHAWVWCLAHNLYSAACACHSYDLGANPPAVEPTKRIQLRTGVATIPGAIWRPGCGRGAP